MDSLLKITLGATCLDMVVCRGCYSQIHEIHPIHAFLVVPEIKKSEPANEPNGAIEPGERCKIIIYPPCKTLTMSPQPYFMMDSNVRSKLNFFGFDTNANA